MATRKRTRRMRRKKGRLTKSSKRAVKSIVRKEINKITEPKWFYRFGATDGGSGGLVNTSGVMYKIVPGELITMGNTKSARTGSSIRYLGFNVRLFLSNKSSAWKMGVRIMYVKKRQPNYDLEFDLWEDNDTIPEPTGTIEQGEGDPDHDDMNTSLDAGLNEINAFNQLYRKVNKNNYQVLYNRVIYLDRNVTTDGMRNSDKVFSKYFKSAREITYNSEGIEKGAEYVFGVFYHYLTGDLVGPTTPDPQIEFLELKDCYVD